MELSRGRPGIGSQLVLVVRVVVRVIVRVVVRVVVRGAAIGPQRYRGGPARSWQPPISRIPDSRQESGVTDDRAGAGGARHPLAILRLPLCRRMSWWAHGPQWKRTAH